MSIDYSLGIDRKTFKIEGSLQLHYSQTSSSYVEETVYYPDGVETIFYPTYYNYGRLTVIGTVQEAQIGLAGKFRITSITSDVESTRTPQVDSQGFYYPAEYADNVFHERHHLKLRMDYNTLLEPVSGQNYSGDITIDLGYIDFNMASGHASTPSLPASIAFSMEFAADFETRVSVSEPTSEGRETIWKGYAGRDPNGLYPGTTTVYLVPTGTATYTFTLGASSETVEIEDFADAVDTHSSATTWKNGINGYSGTLKYAWAPNIWQGGEMSLGTTLAEWASISFTSATPTDSIISDNCKIVVSNGVCRWYANNGPININPGTYAVNCTPHDLSLGVSATNLDGSSVAAVCTMACGISGTANGDPLVKSYDGNWSLTLFDTESYGDVPTVGTWAALHDVGGEITNLESLGQPIFRHPDPDGDSNLFEYSDSKLEALSPYGAWSDALRFTAPTGNTKIIGFADHTWTASTGVTTSIVDGKLQVVVASDAVSPKISRDFADSKTFTGTRYIQLDYDSEDTNPITLAIAGREWAVSNNGARTHIVDSITPNNLPSGGDATNTLFDDMTTPIGSLWTIRNAGVIELRLKGGCTYTFDALSATRAEEGKRSVTARVFAHTFVGDAVGHTRQTDTELGTLMPKPIEGDFELLTQAEQESGNFNAWPRSRVRARNGIVSIDGALAYELWGMEHYSTQAGSTIFWHHESLPMNSARAIYPAPVSYLSKTFEQDTNQPWKTGALPAAWLTSGVYTGENQALVNWQPIITKFVRPFCLVTPTCSYAVPKKLKGNAYARILKANGTPAGTAQIKRYKGTMLVQTTTITPDANGWVNLGSLPQPTTDDYELQDWRFEVVIGELTAEFTMRNRNTSYIQLVASALRGLLYGASHGKLIFGSSHQKLLHN